MRLALNFRNPAIEAALRRHAAGAERVELSAAGAPVGDVDVLLTPLAGTRPLAELLPAGHWLYGHPRVRVSPHIAWSAPGRVDRMLGVFLRNLDAFAQGRPLEGVADAAAGY